MKLKEEAEKQYRDHVSRQAAKEPSTEGDRAQLNEKNDSTWGKISFLNGVDIAKLSNDHLKRHLAARSTGRVTQLAQWYAKISAPQ